MRCRTQPAAGAALRLEAAAVQQARERILCRGRLHRALAILAVGDVEEVTSRSSPTGTRGSGTSSRVRRARASGRLAALAGPHRFAEYLEEPGRIGMDGVLEGPPDESDGERRGSRRGGGVRETQTKSRTSPSAAALGTQVGECRSASARPGAAPGLVLEQRRGERSRSVTSRSSTMWPSTLPRAPADRRDARSRCGGLRRCRHSSIWSPSAPALRDRDRAGSASSIR